MGVLGSHHICACCLVWCPSFTVSVILDGCLSVLRDADSDSMLVDEASATADEACALVISGVVRATAAHFTQLMQLHGARGDFDAAFACISTAREAGVALDAFAFNVLLRLCVSCKVVGRVPEVVAAMEAAGVARDAHTYHALTEVYDATGDVDAVAGVLSDMATKGLQAIPANLAAVVRSLIAHGDLQRAWNVVRDATGGSGSSAKPQGEDAIQASSGVLNALLKAWMQGGTEGSRAVSPDDAMAMAERLRVCGAWWTPGTYQLLLKGWARASEWERVWQMFYRMLRDGESSRPVASRRHGATSLLNGRTCLLTLKALDCVQRSHTAALAVDGGSSRASAQLAAPLDTLGLADPYEQLPEDGEYPDNAVDAVFYVLQQMTRARLVHTDGDVLHALSVCVHARQPERAAPLVTEVTARHLDASPDSEGGALVRAYQSMRPHA